MRRARTKLTILTAALCAAVVVAAASAGQQSGALLLPDLVQRAPSQIQITEDEGRFELGFASAVVNTGAGPLVIRGTRGREQRQMSAAQRIDRADGRGALTRRRVGVVRYTREETHQHWHLLRFDRYTLRRAGQRTIVVADRKSGFCLGDRFRPDIGRQLPGEPAQPPFTHNCGLGRPDLRRITEGISVGYGDDYGPFLEGQFLDVTGLPEGEYDLVHRVNAERLLLEERYDNNAACLRLRIAWPRGPGERPSVRRRGRC